MAVNLSPIGGVAGQFFDNNGDPLVGGKLYTYSAGTTTPQVTYTSATGVTPNSNPIILNGGGRVPAEIWLTDGLQYKFVLYTSTDTLIGSWDNIIGINSNFVNFVTSEEVQTATAGQTVFTLTTMQYQPGTNNLVVYVDGVNQVEGGTYSFVETSSTVVTFVTGLHVGALVKFVSAETLSTGVTDASLVAYEPAGVGAVTTTVQAKLRETVSVKDFGAVGDGVTDDTAAIQAALDADVALEVPEGNYLVGALTISNPLVLKGVGNDRTVFTIKTDIGQNNMFTASGVDGIEVTGCKFDFRNDVVTPNFSDLTKQNVFHLTSCSNVTITNNHFVRGLNQFVRFDGTAIAENVNVYIEENVFEDGGKGAVEVRRYGRNVHVCNNNLTNVCNQTISGIAVDKSIGISGTIGVWIKDNYVLQTISGGGSIIVEFIDRQSEAVNILNNRVDGSSENSIKVGASVDVLVEGNSCMYSTANGIYIEGCYDAIVQNNYCYESGANAVGIYEDGDTGRLNRNITVRGNTIQNSNMAGATLGVSGVSAGSQQSYHITCRQSSFIYIYENIFADNTTGQAGGIFMAATDYYIERNDMLGLKAGSVTFTNTGSVISDKFKIVDNKGAQTTAKGLAAILSGTSFITVTPDVVNEASNKIMQATPFSVLSGTVAYWCCLNAANNTFSISTQNSSHLAANVTTDTNFNWSFSVDNAIGIFGKTTR